MKTKSLNYKTILSWIPAFIWLIIILIFSAQDSTQSSYESMGIAQKLHEIFNIPVVQIELIIREGSHFIEYLLLGIFIYIGISNTFIMKSCKIVIYSIIFSILYAISDEIHQIFIPGRTFQLIDLALDSLGSILGVMLIAKIKK